MDSNIQHKKFTSERQSKHMIHIFLPASPLNVLMFQQEHQDRHPDYMHYKPTAPEAALHLFCVVVGYYTLSYIISGITGPSLRIPISGTLPFYLEHDFYSGSGLAAWINLVLGMLLTAAPHIRIVMQAVPTSVVWWITLLLLLPLCVVITLGLQRVILRRFLRHTEISPEV
eukprot:gene9694-1903_t